jgi:hypothetical protein
MKIKKVVKDIVKMNNYNLRCLQYIIFLTGLFVIHEDIYSQSIVTVEKKSCPEQSGYTIDIVAFDGEYRHIITRDQRFTSYSGETLIRKFNDISDFIKLETVRQLLSFQYDTSLCCYPVQELPFDGNDGRCGCPIGKQYTIQIDALFLINAICFEMCRSYACVPMIMDTITGKCVNEDTIAIKEVYQKYIEWYNICVEKGNIGKYFPFNDGRYVWKNGRKGFHKKEE